MADDCTHIPSTLPTTTPQAEGCQECVAMGAEWVHLRVCVACGHVGCCDQSQHRHARNHFGEHPEHPLIRSFEPGEAWWYCFADDYGFEFEGVGPLRE